MQRHKDQKHGGLCISIFFEKLKIVVKNPEKGIKLVRHVTYYLYLLTRYENLMGPRLVINFYDFKVM